MLDLRPAQLEDLGFLLQEKKALLLHEPGVGKTPPVCVWLYALWETERVKSLWVQPKSLLTKNRDELLRFTGFAPEDVVILEKPFIKCKPSEQNSLKRYMATGKGRIARWLFDYREHWDRLAEGETIWFVRETNAKVILCGFRFATRFFYEMFEFNQDLKCLAVDEIHMGYGSNNSQNTKAFYEMMRYCDYFVGMTGTLANGRLDSVFPAIHVIEPRYYGSFQGFMHEHAGFVDDYGRVLAWRNEAKIGQILLRHGRRRTFAETYGPEQVLFQPLRIPMGEAMAEAYDEFHELAMLELEDGKILDGSLPGVNAIRARQILAHPETFGLCKGEETGKDEWLRVQVDDATANNTKMLIFSTLVPEQERTVELLRSMGRRAVLMNGSVSAKLRADIDQAFRAGEIDDVVGSPLTMAVGWNWEHVDHVIALTSTYNDVDFIQAYRRADRGTRRYALRVSVPQYADSIERRVYQIIHQKSLLANRVDPTRPVLDLVA